jgi:hypothetical protein
LLQRSCFSFAVAAEARKQTLVCDCIFSSFQERHRQHQH